MNDIKANQEAVLCPKTPVNLAYQICTIEVSNKAELSKCIQPAIAKYQQCLESLNNPSIKNPYMSSDTKIKKKKKKKKKNVSTQKLYRIELKNGGVLRGTIHKITDSTISVNDRGMIMEINKDEVSKKVRIK